MLHTVRIQPFVLDRYMAKCSCGWATFGSKLECELRASCHDLDSDDPTPAKPISCEREVS